MMTRSLFLTALLLTTTASSAVVDRRQLASPVSTLQPGGPVRVAASAEGMFLVQGHRVSNDGLKLDSEPIIGSEGYAVGWRDSWLLVGSTAGQLSVRKLRTDGVITPLFQVRALGAFIAAAASADHDRVAILELTPRTQFGPSSIWITVAREGGVLQRHLIGEAEGGAIAPFGEGFLVVTHVREGRNASLLHAWQIDARGVPQEVKPIGRLEQLFFGNIDVVVEGAHALVTTLGSSHMTARIVDANLLASDPITLVGQGFEVPFATPFATPDRFPLFYGMRRGGVTEGRVMELNRRGERFSDSVQDPVAAGGRAGTRYLVMRPWGDAAVAEEDPRLLISPAIRFLRRAYEHLQTINPTVSGDVTLIAYGNETSRFVRVEANGEPIDREPLPLPAPFPYSLLKTSITAIPDGFAFVWLDVASLRYQRLSRRGGWIDAVPRTLEFPGTVQVIAAHGNDRDLLVAATTAEEILWRRFDFGGTPLDVSTSRTPHVARPSGGRWGMLGVTGNGPDRLVLAQQTFECYILCPSPPLSLEVLALDAAAEPLGPVRAFESAGSGKLAAGLADGTWVVPIVFPADEVLHLSRDGALIRRVVHPLLQGGLTDLATTSTGWKAIAENPLRVVEVALAGQPVRVTGLSGLFSPRFGSRDQLVFTAAAEGAPVLAPWLGRLSTQDGDLSLSVTELPRGGGVRQLELTIRNEGSSNATNVFVAPLRFGNGIRFLGSGTERGEIPLIRPGASYRLQAILDPSPGSSVKFLVLSDDVSDIDVSDNIAPLPPAPPPTPPRNRGVSQSGR